MALGQGPRPAADVVQEAALLREHRRVVLAALDGRRELILDPAQGLAIGPVRGPAPIALSRPARSQAIAYQTYTIA